LKVKIHSERKSLSAASKRTSAGNQQRAQRRKGANDRFIIEDVYPSVDAGQYAVKRVVGEVVEVWADILRHGHDELAASLLWRHDKEKKWRREPLRLHGNNRWAGSFTPASLGRHFFAVEAWTDEYQTWRRGFLLKQQAGAAVPSDLEEGALLIQQALADAGDGASVLEQSLAAWRQSGEASSLTSEAVLAILAELPPGADAQRSQEFPLYVDRARAKAGAWYELFPRSQSMRPGEHGTFDDCIRELPRIADLGFDVLYLTPIHPIGDKNRKGKNNALTAADGDPGSPYAIGSAAGGHDAVHPQLGTLDDFRRLVQAAHRYEMEIALDFAVQCSPDHPWLSLHPDWFKRRPDGSIGYAENPPKRYEDIVNPDLTGPRSTEIRLALRNVLHFWIETGVRIFRVDNPHTKPFDFWRWLIADIQADYPDVIFLAEAFTKPKVMKALAKLGFTQSYTYFTWRTGKQEIEEYLREITGYPEREYFRPNFFVNTPDILPYHLQSGERWIFEARAALAATLSGNYGIYSGFELLEHASLPGREEYLDAEKYELKFRDWNKPGNINSFIRQLNHIRRENSALLQTSRLRFMLVDHPNVIAFIKESDDGENAVVITISLAGPEPKDFWLHFGDQQIGPERQRAPVTRIENLVTGEIRPLAWGGVRLQIVPSEVPAIFLRCLR
jgi:starch synthase (maltosyl-transferring)